MTMSRRESRFDLRDLQWVRMLGRMEGLAFAYAAREYKPSGVYERPDALGTAAEPDEPRLEMLRRPSLAARRKHGLERARESGVIEPMPGQTGLCFSYTPALRRVARVLARNRRVLPVLLLVHDKGPLPITAIGDEFSLGESEVIAILANLLGLDLLTVGSDSVSITSSGKDVVTRVRSVLGGATP